MAYTTGTANTPEELLIAIGAFATRTLGNFTDLFGGSRGESAFGGTSVLGLSHNDTSAAYLFELVSGLSMNNLSTEHVLVGQLLSSASGGLQFNANDYIGQEGDNLILLPDSAQTSDWTTAVGQTLPGSSTLVDIATFVARYATELPGSFSGCQVGGGLIVKENQVHASVTYSHHVYEVVATRIAEGILTGGLPNDTPLAFPAYQQEVDAVYIGSYNETGGSIVLPSRTATGNLNIAAFYRTTFTAVDQDFLAVTPLNEFSTGMWGEGVTSAEMADGWFPRSGRLNFTTGVDFTFYGDGVLGNEYFHMVLQTQGEAKKSHWWLGRLNDGGLPTTTESNSTGMFLGTSGPHTDAQGVDTYQYPFSYTTAQDAYRNPCTIIAEFTDDGVRDTIQQQDGGRLFYGPTGVNHLNTYGPNDTSMKTLNSTVYSIQSGLNGFATASSIGMEGGRGRTEFPLRPWPTEALTGYDKFYTNPWVPLDAINYSLPMATDRVTLTSEGSFHNVADITAIPLETGQTRSTNADGWSEMDTGFTSVQGVKTIVSPIGTLTHTADATNDRMEFRVRLKTDKVGGTYNAQGIIYTTTAVNTAWGGGPDYYQLFTMPAEFWTGEWVTMSVPFQGAGYTGNIDGLRLDVIRYVTLPTAGAVFEFDYISLGKTKVQREAGFNATNGAYAVRIGQFPGVNRGTLNLAPPAIETALVALFEDTSVVFEDDTYDMHPASERGLGIQRPHDPTVDSGIAGYVYKR